MNNTTHKLLSAINDVLKIVDSKEFISHLYDYKNNYNNPNKQDVIIKKIMQVSCSVIGVSINDILHTTNNYKGKRIMAIGIIGMLIKKYIPHYSYQRICTELEDTVSLSNFQKYVNRYKDFKPNEKIKQEVEVAKQIDTINYEILKFLKDEKLR